MRWRIPVGLVVGLFLVSLLSAQIIDPPGAPVPLEPAVPLGTEVLGKGPVHEAYARPTDDRPTASPLVGREPPALVEELPPDERPEGSAWLPGYWQFDDDRNDFIWISGFWRVPPPNRQWVPGQFQRVETGWRWVPGFWAAAAQRDLTYLPVPPASLEIGPATPQPQEEALYIPGSWVYHDTAYHWRAGFWTAYRPGWVWCPAQYYWTPAGYVFVDGFWDVPLERRGCLFAPVVFQATVLRPGFVYTPRYVVTHDFLPSALFVRPSCGHYYFGDYYAARYSTQGYNFWFDYRYGRSCPDPLFVHYRHERRGQNWEVEVRAVYVGRQRGTLPLPPPTLTAQLAPPIILPGPRLAPAPMPTPAPLAPFSAKSAGPGLQLAKMAAPEREAVARNSAEIKALATQRTTLEKPARLPDAPRTVGLKLAAAPPPVSSPAAAMPAGGSPRTVGNPPPTGNKTPVIISGPGTPIGNPVIPPPMGGTKKLTEGSPLMAPTPQPPPQVPPPGNEKKGTGPTIISGPGRNPPPVVNPPTPTGQLKGGGPTIISGPKTPDPKPPTGLATPPAGVVLPPLVNPPPGNKPPQIINGPVVPRTQGPPTTKDEPRKGKNPPTGNPPPRISNYLPAPRR